MEFRSSMTPLALVATVTGSLTGSQALPKSSAPAPTTAGQSRETSGRLLEELARIAGASRGTVGVAAIDLATGDVTQGNSCRSRPASATLRQP